MHSTTAVVHVLHAFLQQQDRNITLLEICEGCYQEGHPAVEHLLQRIQDPPKTQNLFQIIYSHKVSCKQDTKTN